MANATRTIVADADALAREAADRIAAALEASVAARGRAHLALAGGSTPRRAYEQLAALHGARVPWGQVEIWFGDERCVPPDHPDSNYGMAHAALLSRVALPPAQVHRMAGEREDREAAAAEYAAALPSAFDLLLLGLGPDGHTASLFPGSPALGEAERRVVAVVGPKPPPHRLTLTPPAFAAARAVLVLACGSDKASAVARSLARDATPEATPACLLAERDWLLDRAAAADLDS
ncbi:MAG: 6-phosphogluconolactonase [Planctomycetes bacterium]|nr:6-phosphogluconolactonase [Planctomycetota bacterium]